MFFKKLFTFSSVLTRIVSPYSCFLVNDSNRMIHIRKLVCLFERAIEKHFNFSYLGDRCLFDTKWNWFRSWRIRRPFEPILSGSLGILSIATCFGFCDIFLQQSWQVDAQQVLSPFSVFCLRGEGLKGGSMRAAWAEIPATTSTLGALYA